MNKEKQIELISKLDKENLDILHSKGADYATVDVLSNFKRVSDIVKSMNLSIDTPVGYALFMTLMKIDRINNLLSDGRTPNNESVEDSFKDGINYFKLAYLNYIENK